MKISYYTHAWQCLLMLLAGMISVVAACAGYLQGGGGDELLRSALRTLKSGKASFDRCQFELHSAELRVYDIQHEDVKWLDSAGKAAVSISGLRAEQLSVKLELFPWPPKVSKYVVRGAKNVEIALSENFLRGGALPSTEKLPLPPVRFEECGFRLLIGKMRPLLLTGCSGEVAADGSLSGSFSLQELNGKPFGLKLNIQKDGWVLSGEHIKLDTRETLQAPSGVFAESLDPLGILIKTLFSGETAAEGELLSLKIAVTPQPFSCEGTVAYSNLNLRLPPAGQPSGEVLPAFLGQLLGGDERAGESLWPRWMRVDSLKSGPSGRLHFQMQGGQLDFYFNEGAEGALTGVRQGQELPPLEGLRGSVVTSQNGKPVRISLQGRIGAYDFESRIERAANNSRAYDLKIQPRGGTSAGLRLDDPLWRFSSKITDYFSVQPRPTLEDGNVMAAFQVEMDVMDFPAMGWLPPGLQGVSGTLRATGRITDKYLLRFDNAEIIATAAISPAVEGQLGSGNDFMPLWEGFRALSAPEQPWQLLKLDIGGPADVSFSPDLRWSSIHLDQWAVTECQLSRGDKLTDWRNDKLKMDVRVTRKSDDTSVARLEAAAACPEWSGAFNADWRLRGEKPSGRFVLIEKNIPAARHPAGRAPGTHESVVRLNDGIVTRTNTD